MGQGDGARREDGLFRGCRPGRAASGGGVPGRQLEKQHPPPLLSPLGVRTGPGARDAAPGGGGQRPEGRANGGPGT